MISYTLLLFSIGLHLAGLVKHLEFLKQHRIVATLATGFFAVFSGFFLVADYFTGEGIDASVFYHLQMGITGAGYSDYWQLILVGVLAIALVTSMPLLFAFLSREGNVKPVQPNLTFWIFIIASFLISPTTYHIVGHYLPPGVHMPGLNRIQFSDVYRTPQIEPIGKKRNLVYLYVEGLERTYFELKSFPGLMPRLQSIASRSTEFVNVGEAWRTNWTIAGITASQCGVPLVTSSDGNAMSGMDVFLPNITCLGDLLSQQGYHLAYFSGSSAEFGGTRKFLNTHGFDEIRDKDALVPTLIDQSYQSTWGLYDDSLLDIAFNRFKELSSGNEQFGLFVSTIDTHPPDGHVAEKCRGKISLSDNPMLNAVACADLMIGDFINSILNSGHADNTVIVVTSDHLAMRNSASDLLNTQDRRNLFLVIDPLETGSVVDSQGTMLDIAPTILPYLGFSAEVGLGRDLNGEGRSLAASIAGFNYFLRHWEAHFNAFWDYPSVNRDHEIKFASQAVDIDGRSFGYPVLVEFKENGETEMRFEFDIFGRPSSRLVNYIQYLPEGRPFLWIDRCSVMATRTFQLRQADCVMYGRATSGGATLAGMDDLERIRVSEIFEQPTDRRGSYHEVDRFIAHAGGAIDGRIYTNSLEALNHNYAQGFRLFELDIIKTSDDHFVAYHDWALWQRNTGFKGPIPPTRAEFLSDQAGDLTHLDIDGINEWFSQHPDTLLVTDKVNTPQLFAEKFLHKDRLMMELFTLDAVNEGLSAGIKSAMPSWSVLRDIPGNKVVELVQMGVTDIAATYRIIQRNRSLLNNLKSQNIRVYVFNVNADPGIDENFVVCNYLETVYGLYADTFNFSQLPECKHPDVVFAEWLK